MKSMLRRLTNLLIGDSQGVRPADNIKSHKNLPLQKITRRELLRRESRIGASLFGPLPRKGQREFFCLDETTWIWYEQWVDEKGKTQSVTTRYEVGPEGVLKVQDGARYRYVDAYELGNLLAAARLYRQRVAAEIYGRPAGIGYTRT